MYKNHQNTIRNNMISKISKLGLSLILALIMISHSNLSQAAEIQLLDQGVYPYIGFGAGAALISGVATPSYTQPEERERLALGSATQTYASLAFGFVWKRTSSPGWHSMFQVSYRPLSFSVRDGDTTHNYRQNMASLDFLESYGFFNNWVPYIGISWNFYDLNFEDTSSDTGAISQSTNRLGLVGGWDIMSNPNSKWRFRTNFRLHSEIPINYNGGRVGFPNFEIEPFNFIYRF